MTNLETIIGRTLEGARANSQALIEGLSYNYDIIVSNKEALASQLSAGPSETAPVVSTTVSEPSYEEPVYDEPEPQAPAKVQEPEPQPVDDDDDDDEFDYDDID